MAKVICIRTKAEVSGPREKAELRLCMELQRIYEEINQIGAEQAASAVKRAIKFLNQQLTKNITINNRKKYDETKTGS